MPILRELRPHPRTRLRRTDYTDLMLVIGPDERWAEDDYLDLVEARPEVLLGYRVITMGVSTLVNSEMRFGRPSKIIMLDGYARNLSTGTKCRVDAEIGYWRVLHGAKVEHWHVHRVRGIWRIS